VVADDQAGLRAAIREVLSDAAYQRCYVHFLRNALDHLPRKADDDCLQELRWLYHCRSVEEARRDRSARIAKWEGSYPRLVAWAEETIEETLTSYRLPRQNHKNLKSTNMLEPLNEETRGARMWCGSSPMRLHAAGRCGPWQWRRTRTGSRPTAIST